MQYDLQDFFQDFVDSGLTIEPPRSFSQLQGDSRKIVRGDVFLYMSTSEDYLEEAIRLGCIAIVYPQENDLSTQATQLLKQAEQQGIVLIKIANFANQYADLLNRFFAIDDLQLVGITGTNGKTSSVHLLASLLAFSGKQVGVLGTLGNGIYYPDGQVKLTPSPLTTLDSLTLYQHLDYFKQQSVSIVLMEVSSHGIAQQRIVGLKFQALAFTNLTHEHLDFHGTMENYFQVKQQLFDDYLKQGGTIAVNRGNDYGERLYQHLTSIQDSAQQRWKQLLSYRVIGQSESSAEPNNQLKNQSNDITDDLQLQVEEIFPHGFAVSIALKDETQAKAQGDTYKTDTYKTEVNILTLVQLENLLVAFSLAVGLGFSPKQLLPAIQQIRSIAGRAQQVAEKPLVVVDYAHTPDALETVLKSLRLHLTQGKLWCVFGCGGNRDATKRAMMGAIAERYADIVVVTDDNPRFEDATIIRQAIMQGMQQPDHCHSIGDRRVAIQYALQNASEDHIVLIAGKGHEVDQIIQGKRYPHDDAEFVKQLQNKEFIS